MLGIFSLRLALGALGCLFLLPSAVVNPRFYRTHFLIALGLVTLTTLFNAENDMEAALWAALIAAGIVCFVGSVIYLLEGAPGGWIAMIAAFALTAISLFLFRPWFAGWELADDTSAAAVLGASLTAMLMGHSYLIAPAMSLSPLRRLLIALTVALLLRWLLAGVGLWSLTARGGTLETETLLWLVVRWTVGFLIPLVLCWMGWQTTNIRSTQSATGILYVVVILCFLGELTGQLLQAKTGYIL